jgi:hypothetical protein
MLEMKKPPEQFSPTINYKKNRLKLMLETVII